MSSEIISVRMLLFFPSPARRQKHIVVTCLTCGKLKRFHTKADYQLWSERVTHQQQQQEEEGSRGEPSTQEPGSTTQPSLSPAVPLDQPASAQEDCGPAVVGQSEPASLSAELSVKQCDVIMQTASQESTAS